MKVVIDCRVISVTFPIGISRFTTSLVGELYKLLPFTVMICDKRQLQFLPKDVPYIMGPPMTAMNQRHVTKMLNDFGADVVVAPTVFFTIGKRNFTLISALHDTNGLDVKRIFGHEAPLSDKIQWHLYHATKWPLRATLNGSDHIITVSESARQSIIRHKLTRRPISVIYNAPAPSTPVPYQASSKTLVYMGTFYHYKNVKTLIMAMEHLPDYTLVCLSKISPKTKQALLKFAKNPAQVIFKNGVTDEEYHQYLAGAAALVTASKFEGFGLPLVEAQALGIPVVCSDIEVFHEVCEPGSALFFNPNKPEDFAQAVHELPDNAPALIQAGHKNAQRFTWRSSAKALAGVIEHYKK